MHSIQSLSSDEKKMRIQGLAIFWVVFSDWSNKDRGGGRKETETQQHQATSTYDSSKQATRAGRRHHASCPLRLESGIFFPTTIKK
jgi:hypothetical protein